MRVLRKLRGRTFHEVRVRAGQAGAMLVERLLSAPLPGGLTKPWPGSFADADAVLQAFKDVQPPIPGVRDPKLTASLLTPAMREAAIVQAEGVLAHRFRLFGGTEFDFGAPPAWHFEPRARLHTPQTHWSRIDYLDAKVAGDKKIVWELNRQQFLMTLGRAYAVSRNERYADAVAGHVVAWIDGNPFKRGINWASALEVAYRSIAWLWALAMVRGSPHLTPEVLLPALAVLRLAGRHVETYLSTYFSPNTHLTGEALALLHLGLALPFLPEAERWRSKGRAVLLHSLARQVRPDGTYFENATYYHRYTLDIFMFAAVLGEASGEPLDGVALARIERLADALAAQIRPDGTHGYFGDDDGGRLLPLGEEPLNDFRPAISNAAVLFGRADFKACAETLAEETLWLFGPDAVRRYAAVADQLRPEASRAFPDGGVYVMRDGGGRGANQLVIDCGAHGALNCGHAHADTLAFELVAGGRTLLLDPGTYTYTGDASARRAFRSTAFHNALTVDGASSSEPAGPFNWASIARTRLHGWWSSVRFDHVEGSHDGFLRLPDPVSCRREILFIKGSYWIMRDRAAGSAPHLFAQHFHFCADATPTIEAGGFCREDGPAGLDLVSFAPGGAWRLEDGWVSTRYTDRRAAKVAVYSVNAQPSVDIVTIMVPRDGGRAAPPPSATAARAGRAFTLGRDGQDLFVVGDAGALNADGLESDAAWVWLRRRRGLPAALVVRAARTLSLSGRRLMSASQPVDLALWVDGDAVEAILRGSEAEVDLAALDCSKVLSGSTLLRLQDGSNLRLRMRQ